MGQSGQVSDEAIRDRWRRLRDDLDQRGVAAKDSMGAIFGLSRAYGSLTDREREEVNAVFG
jgi:hypothetical protein